MVGKVLIIEDDETDKIVGLETGADDYVTKPFITRELLARVRAILRRTKMVEAPSTAWPAVIKTSELEIDTARNRASLAGSALKLSPKEFDLLVFLAKNKGLVFSREQLLEKVWSYDYAGDTPYCRRACQMAQAKDSRK
jgi:two-component system alkaline phosphatase synthesis response regulator PhoP